jgi:hypothetical protein
MGQQQLLLLTLSTVIVGLAVVAGIEMFDQNRRQATADQMTQVALRIASDVQQYAKRPGFMRAGNTTANDNEDENLVVDFGELQHYSPKVKDPWDGDYVDDVAQYSLNGYNSLPGEYDESACPSNNPVNTVNAYNSDYDISVCVGIAGTSADDLEAGVVHGQ